MPMFGAYTASIVCTGALIVMTSVVLGFKTLLPLMRQPLNVAPGTLNAVFNVVTVVCGQVRWKLAKPPPSSCRSSGAALTHAPP